jgi:hypothetical protein
MIDQTDACLPTHRERRRRRRESRRRARKGIAGARTSGLAFLVTASGYERGSLRRGGVVVRAVGDGWGRYSCGGWPGDRDGW